MANNFNSTTFSDVYKDDYRDSDHYHRILFNSGRALQARELTQSQTILSRELERMGRYLFKEGSLISSHMGGILTSDVAISFVKLDESSNPLPSTYNTLVGTVITGNTGSIKAVVKEILPERTENSITYPATILLEYVDADQEFNADLTKTISFAPGEFLTTDTGTLRITTTNTPSNPATGRGSMIETQSAEMFVLGHFVNVDAQKLVIDAYNDFPNDTIGFKVTEDIVTTTDTTALYDNAGATPNLTSPGADRYRISLALAKLSDIEVDDTFIRIIDIVNGETRELQNQDNILNTLGATLSRRTREESGNYTVRSGERFKLSVTKDSADDPSLRYEIGTGVAYIEGERIENRSSYRDLTVPASRTAETIVGETLGVEHGSFFLASTLKGGLWTEQRDYGNVNLRTADNHGGSTIGTAKMKDISRVVDDGTEFFRIHVFDINMDSNGAGILYNVSAVESIGTSSNNYANTVAENGQVRLYQPSTDKLMFRLPKSRAKRITADTLSMVVKDFKEVTATGTTLSLTPNDSFQEEEFADADEWLITDTTDGTTENVDASSTFDFQSSPNGDRSATITGVTSGRTYRIAFYVSIAGRMKTKSLNTVTETITPASDGRVYLKSDVYEVNTVTDTGGRDIRSRYRVHDGATAYAYDRGYLLPKKGLVPESGNVTVNYSYFSHTDGDFFGPGSYDGVIPYGRIPPYFEENGYFILLQEAIDLRPVQASDQTYTSSGGQTPRLPRNNDIITCNVDYYQGRIDRIYITSDGDIEVASSTPSLAPQYPTVPDNNSMLLHTVFVNPYTFNETDLVIRSAKNKGYQMTDIHKLSRRIENLEEYATLTAAESKLLTTTVEDGVGDERRKLGLVGDGFTNWNSTAISHPDHKAAISTVNGIMTSRNIKRDLELTVDLSNSTGVVVKGGQVWPSYTEVAMIEQNTASSVENVNQFTLQKFKGDVQLSPDHDYWTITKTTISGLGKSGVEVDTKNGQLSSYEGES